MSKQESLFVNPEDNSGELKEQAELFLSKQYSAWRSVALWWEKSSPYGFDYRELAKTQRVLVLQLQQSLKEALDRFPYSCQLGVVDRCRCQSCVYDRAQELLKEI